MMQLILLKLVQKLLVARVAVEEKTLHKQVVKMNQKLTKLLKVLKN
jgi:hypothetical protein